MSLIGPTRNRSCCKCVRQSLAPNRRAGRLLSRPLSRVLLPRLLILGAAVRDPSLPSAAKFAVMHNAAAIQRYPPNALLT